MHSTIRGVSKLCIDQVLEFNKLNKLKEMHVSDVTNKKKAPQLQIFPEKKPFGFIEKLMAIINNKKYIKIFLLLLIIIINI